MMGILTLLRDHRYKAAVIAALLTIWTASYLFIPEDATLKPGPYTEASEDMVTNCDVGALGGCGSAELLLTAAIIFVLIAVVGFFISLPKRVRDR